MKNLKAWLEKNNYNYEVVKLGYDYFYNAPKIEKEAVIIKIPLKDAVKYNKLKIHQNRYNYIGVWDGINPDIYAITLIDNASYNDLTQYETARNASVQECENLIHRYHTEPLAINLNRELEKIMYRHGTNYNMTLAKNQGVA